MMRLVCAFFGHEARGLHRQVNTHDATICVCGRKMIGNMQWELRGF